MKAAVSFVKERCTNECNAEPGKPAMAGDCGAAMAGYRGAATAGDCGAAMAGDCGGATGKMTESQRDYQLAAEAIEQAYGVLERALVS